MPTGGVRRGRTIGLIGQRNSDLCERDGHVVFVGGAGAIAVARIGCPRRAARGDDGERSGAVIGRFRTADALLRASSASPKDSAGVLNLSVFRGRSVKAGSDAFSLAWLNAERSVPLGSTA